VAEQERRIEVKQREFAGVDSAVAVELHDVESAATDQKVEIRVALVSRDMPRAPPCDLAVRLDLGQLDVAQARAANAAEKIRTPRDLDVEMA
jgi:hypothetical protein